jgi:hypothetical protein
VILLHDTTPDQEKDLLELKVKKVKIAPALDLADTNGESAEDRMIEDSAAHDATAAEVEDDGSQSLYFVDEDEEDAKVPDDFEYESEGKGGDRMEE